MTATLYALRHKQCSVQKVPATFSRLGGMEADRVACFTHSLAVEYAKHATLLCIATVRLGDQRWT